MIIMRRLFCFFLLFAFAFQACGSVAQDSVSVDSIAVVQAPWQVDSLDGFVLKQTTITDKRLFGSNQVISLIEVPRSSRCRLAFGYDSLLTETSLLAERHGALAAVNGSYFDMDNGNPICYLRINGEAVGENTPSKTDSVNRKYYQYATLALRHGRPRIVVPDSNRQWETTMPDSNIMTAGPLLLYRGSVVPQRNDRSFVTARHNRTALGIRKDGTVVIVAVDGRFKKHAEGFSLPELAQVMLWLGCRDAINLDGGGSTTMYVQGAPSGGVVNYPSDNRTFDHQGQRPVSNILMLVPR